MADIKLTIDDSQIIQSLENLEKKLAQAGAAADETGKKAGEAFSGTEADVKRAAESLAAYTAAQEKLKAGANDRIKKNIELREGLLKFRKEQEAFNAAAADAAKKNAEVTSGLAAQAQTTKAAEGATKGATVAQRLWNVVMSANPIGLIVAAIAILVNQIRKYQSVIDFASKITSQIGAVFTVVTDRVISFGKAIYSLVTLDWAGFGKNSSDAITGFGDAISNAWTQAGNLADATIALRDAQLEAALSTAKLQAASEKYQAIAGNEAKNYNERIAALKTVIGLEEEIAKVKLGFAAQDLANAQNEFALSNKNVAAREALLEKELAYQAAKTESDKNRIQFLTQLTALEKERYDFIKKSFEEVNDLIDKLDVSLEKDPISKKVEQINQGIEKQVEAITNGIVKINEVEKLRPLGGDEIALRQNLQDKLVQVIEQGEDAKISTILDGIRMEGAANDKRKEAEKAAAEGRIKDAKEALAQELELRNALIAITEAEFSNLIATLKAGGASEQEIKTQQLEFTKQINAQKLQAQLDYQKALLALGGNEKEVAIIQAEIQKLQTLLDGIDIPEPKTKDGKPKDLFDLLGLKFDDGQKEAFKQAVGEILDSLSQLADARVQEAQASVDSANEKIQAAEDALNKENDLAKQGLANNSDNAKKALDEAKKLRDNALKEEAKAKKAQIALDSIGQVSSLITASAQTLAKFNGPLLPLGIVLVAAMFAAFAAAKAKALKAAEAPKLRTGKRFEGPTHEQGNEDLVIDGKRPYKVEKGEWLIATAHSREHDQFLSNLNKGAYRGVNLLEKVGGGRSDREHPLGESMRRIQHTETRRAELAEQNHYDVLARAYERSADRIVNEVRSKPVVLPWKQGHKIVTQKENGGTDTRTVLPSE
jgi:hypothetical protein